VNALTWRFFILPEVSFKVTAIAYSMEFFRVFTNFIKLGKF